MKKRLLKTIVFVAVITALCLAVTVTSSAATTEDGFVYQIIADEIMITGYKGTSEDLIIPSEIEDFPVTTIAINAFRNRSDLTGKLVIPETVRLIGSSAFENCSGLTGELILPEAITEIRSYSFYNCEGLTGDLIIPEGVTRIGMDAFAFCKGFDGKLVIPDSVEYIDTSAFYNCNNLTGELKLPSGLKTISDYVFSGCKGFTGNLVIPEGVTYIGIYAFSGCSGFTGQLVFPEAVEEIGELAFIGCSGFTGDLVIPESLTSIPERVFALCNGFTGELIIPEGVTSIGKSAFEECSGFTGDLNIPGNVTDIGEYAFFNCNGLSGEIYLPDSITSIGDNALNTTGGEHVCYEGSEEQWENIIKGELNLDILYLHFDFKAEDRGEDVYTSTCCYPGQKIVVCTCGYIRSEMIPLADCSFTAYTSDNNATCTADGTKTAYCDYGCGKSNTVADTGSALGHAMGEFVVTKEATCTEKGEERADCSGCDYYETKEIEVKAHIYEEIVTAPTCTAQGYTTYICECGDSYVDNYVGVKSHSYASAVTTPATHTKEGVITYTCSACGDGYTEKVAKTPEHIYAESYTVAPTCKAEGYIVHICECGETVKDSFTQKTDHSYQGRVCEYCGAKCSCMCHYGGIMDFIWKIVRFFYKLLGANKVCGCGVVHY